MARGESEARRLRGIADADVIALKVTAEAEAMRKKADSYKEYNQAAVLQVLVAALPDIAKAVAEPLPKTDRITLASTGGDGAGARGSRATSRRSWRSSRPWSSRSRAWT